MKADFNKWHIIDETPYCIKNNVLMSAGIGPFAEYDFDDEYDVEFINKLMVEKIEYQLGWVMGEDYETIENVEE